MSERVILEALGSVMRVAVIRWKTPVGLDLLLQRKGDRSKAMTLLDESLAICSELGMKALMERVQARREKLVA